MLLAAYFPMILTKVTPIAVITSKKFYNIGHSTTAMKTEGV
jgi:hypothetical protein